MREVAFADLPERRSLVRQWRKVYGPRGLKRLHVKTLSDDVLAVWTHYDTSINRVRPCEGLKCPFCLQGLGRRYLAYAAALRADTNEPCIVEITEGAARKLREMGLLPGKLRGYSLTLFRLKDYVNAPVQVEALKLALQNLPAPFDVLPSLLRLWGWNDGHQGELQRKAEDKPKNGPKLRTAATPPTTEEPPY